MIKTGLKAVVFGLVAVLSLPVQAVDQDKAAPIAQAKKSVATNTTGDFVAAVSNSTVSKSNGNGGPGGDNNGCGGGNGKGNGDGGGGDNSSGPPHGNCHEPVSR